jgi:hypothetical protein
MPVKTGFLGNADSLAPEFLRAACIWEPKAISMETVGDLGLEGVRMLEPERLGEILPALVATTAAR